MTVMRILFLFTALTIAAYAQYSEYNPELDWYTLKGKYVDVHYHEGAERTARVVAKIGDEVWEPITSLYEYEPDRVHYVIKDMDDYANGATYFFDNKILIWASALDTDLRGFHNWLRNVISHEFTHMVQIQAAMKMGRKIPAFYVQWLNYEDKRRPDILYGYPNIIASYPLATFNIPAWFAEGTAQYMRKELDYDHWDSHRDMILRSYALDGNMLTWNQMGVFAKTSLGNESVYNSGFALTRYIAQKYGEDKLREITKQLGDFGNYTIDAAFEDVLGKDGNEIYDEWSDFLLLDYTKRIKKVVDNYVAGDTIAKTGFGNFYPVFADDGKSIYYISNKGADYFGLTGLYKYDVETEEEELIQVGIRSTFSIIPGTNKLLYAKLTDENEYSYNIHDLFIYDMEEDEETRLTYGLRANQPNLSNDGQTIVFLTQKDGTTNLASVDINGENFKSLTFFNNGEQLYNPRFAPDDSLIVFDFAYHHQRNIATVKPDGSGYETILEGQPDMRNPVFDSDGNIIFASNETGIFNIYRFNPVSGEKTQLTNVTGGTFMPSVNNEGDIVYAGYTSTGYKIFKITPEQQAKVEPGADYVWLDNPPLQEDKPNGDITNFDIDRLRNFDDTSTPEYEETEYGGAFTNLSIFPFVRFDNYNTSNNALEKIKPGLYLASSDMLDRFSLFAGASTNSRWERDLFLIFDYRDKLPLLYDLGLSPEMSLELYNISRKANVDILVEEFDPAATDVSYNLFEVDVVARNHLFSREHQLELRYIFSRYTATLGSFILPGTTDLYPTTDDTYLIGSNLQLLYEYESYLPSRDMEINPVGFEASLQYNYEMNRFNPDGEYEVADGILKPLYKDFDFHRVELNARTGIGVFKRSAIELRMRAGTILGPAVPDFFDFYLGGIIGMKAYPFYALGGNEIAWVHLAYRFPLFRDIDARLGHLYLDKIYFSVYGDFGNAWTGDFPDMDEFKKGAGAELRIAMTSFYLFPTSLFINASYGFDKFNREINDEVVTYGQEWRFYGGLLFGFDI